MTETGSEDGRRARRSANREKIIEAFLALVRDGVKEPGAHSVAHKAGVSPRTVFRCFEDMEALYRELVIAARKDAPRDAGSALNTSDRAERLTQLVKARTARFADTEPARLAAERYRYRYGSVAQDISALAKLEGERLGNALNPDGALDRDCFEALNAVTSFDFWRRLRLEQGLGKKAAMRAVSHAAQAIYTAAPDPGPIRESDATKKS